MARIQVFVDDPEEWKFRKIEFSPYTLKCRCGSTRFIEIFRANQYNIRYSCVGCGYGYNDRFKPCETGGTEEESSHVQLFIKGVHDDNLFTER